jgi:CSLREA domain-containing protein
MKLHSLALMIAGTMLIVPAVLSAASFTVTRFDDPVPSACTALSCSLREAVVAANSQPGADRIALQPGTYTLTRVDPTPFSLEAGIGPLWVSDSLAIIGAGAETTRIRWSAATTAPHGQGRNEVLTASAAEVGIELNVQGVTVSHGRGDYGGCISVRGEQHLVLRNSIVEECSTTGSGGAIRMEGNLTMSGVKLRNNSAVMSGGAIAFFRTADVITSNVQIYNNSAMNGGAISLSGNPVPYIPSLVWIDDGGLVMSGNTAERGGAIHVSLAQLTLESADEGGAGDWIELSRNQATFGGAIHAMGVSSSIQRFSGVRFLGNRAQSGGALMGLGSLQVTRAEFSDNQATAGEGGAIYLPNSSFTHEASFNEISFRNNLAKGGGGALYSGCRGFEATNVSFGGNKAAAHRGQAIENTGPALLRHATLHNNRDAQGGVSPGIQQVYDANCGDGNNEIMRLANSLITDYCGFNITRLQTAGGNQYGPNAAVCPANPKDRRQTSDAVFRLSEANFGGPMDVWGWTATSLIQVPQRNFGLAAGCAPTDVRGLPRVDGRCDSGAYEQ